MANQTSEIVRKQSTPHSTGRLMDAGFSLGLFVFLVGSISWELQQLARLAN